MFGIRRGAHRYFLRTSSFMLRSIVQCQIMILRQPNLLRGLKQSTSSFSPVTTQICPQQRCIHTRPRLAHEDEISQHGLGQLFSAQGFDMAWKKQMDYLLHHLNRLTADSDDATTPTVKELAMRYARSAKHAAHFNYASQLHNHHFFFEALRSGLEPNQANLEAPSDVLRRSVLKDYSDWDHMRESFVNTADAMFGPGHVWLVRAKNTDPRVGGSLWRWSVLTTYLAGSPYHQAHARRQPTDTNVLENVRLAAKAGMSRRDFERLYPVQNNVGAFGSMAARDEAGKVRDAGGVEVVPALCVSTWEHVWLRDYGIGGKREFLDRFWNAINWDKVRQRVEMTDVSASYDRFSSSPSVLAAAKRSLYT